MVGLPASRHIDAEDRTEHPRGGAAVPERVPGPSPALPLPPADLDGEGPSLLEVVLRRRRMLLLAAVVGAFLGLLVVVVTWFSFRAEARLSLRDPWKADLGLTDQPVGGDFQRFVRGEAHFLQTDAVLDRAAEQLGEPAATLADAVHAAPSASADFVELRVDATTPAQAGQRLDAVLDAYAAARSEIVGRQADTILDAIADEANDLIGQDRSDLERRAAELRIALAAYGDGVAFVEREPVVANLAPLAKIAVPVGGAAGLAGLTALVLWVLAGQRRRVEDPERFAHRGAMAFCGTIPRSTRRRDNAAGTDAVLLALAAVLRRTTPRAAQGTFVVVLADAGGSGGTAVVAERLAAAATSQGARCQVRDASWAAGGTDTGTGTGTSTSTSTSTSTIEGDLLLLTSDRPRHDFAVLAAAGIADAVVLVVQATAPAVEVQRTVAFFDNLGRRPLALISVEAGSRTPKGRRTRP